MSLNLWINQGTTASTTRPPAMSSDKIGTPTVYLENVKIAAISEPRERGANANTLRQLIGLSGSAATIHQTFTVPHAHTKDSSPVTELPDIREGDGLVSDSVTYTVRRVLRKPATTTFSGHLEITMSRDKRI